MTRLDTSPVALNRGGRKKERKKEKMIYVIRDTNELTSECNDHHHTATRFPVRELFRKIGRIKRNSKNSKDLFTLPFGKRNGMERTVFLKEEYDRR